MEIVIDLNFFFFGFIICTLRDSVPIMFQIGFPFLDCGTIVTIWYKQTTTQNLPWLSGLMTTYPYPYIHITCTPREYENVYFSHNKCF